MAHQRYLIDLAVRLLCVLALDRFADFGADHVRPELRATPLLRVASH